MREAKAYSAASATSPLVPTTINRREATERDVQTEILFCGICHSDLHQFGDECGEFMRTAYPIVPGHEIVGRITKVGSAVTKFKPGDLAAVGCLIDSDRTCSACQADHEQFCPNLTLTYNSPDKHLGGVTYGGYSENIVVDEHFVLRVPANLNLARTVPLVRAGITTLFTEQAVGRREGPESGCSWSGRIWAHGCEVRSRTRGSSIRLHDIPNKKNASLRLGADDIALSREAGEMKKHAGSFDFILDTI